MSGSQGQCDISLSEDSPLTLFINRPKHEVILNVINRFVMNSFVVNNLDSNNTYLRSLNTINIDSNYSKKNKSLRLNTSYKFISSTV